MVTVVTVVVVLVCQMGDSFWLRRRIALHSVHIGLLAPWVVALVGYEVYGVGGVAYGLALAVFFLAVLDELGRRSALSTAAEAAEPAEPAEDADAPAWTRRGPSPSVPRPSAAGVPG